MLSFLKDDRETIIPELPDEDPHKLMAEISPNLVGATERRRPKPVNAKNAKNRQKRKAAKKTKKR
jgi:hypothetical protein